VRTLKNEKAVYVENHFPKEQQLEFLQLIGEALPSELLVRDLA
jgi:hypothetical protein